MDHQYVDIRDKDLVAEAACTWHRIRPAKPHRTQLLTSREQHSVPGLHNTATARFAKLAKMSCYCNLMTQHISCSLQHLTGDGQSAQQRRSKSSKVKQDGMSCRLLPCQPSLSANKVLVAVLRCVWHQELLVLACRTWATKAWRSSGSTHATAWEADNPTWQCQRQQQSCEASCKPVLLQNHKQQLQHPLSCSSLGSWPAVLCVHRICCCDSSLRMVCYHSSAQCERIATGTGLLSAAHALAGWPSLAHLYRAGYTVGQQKCCHSSHGATRNAAAPCAFAPFCFTRTYNCI